MEASHTFKQMAVSMFLPEETLPENVLIPKLCHGETITTIHLGTEDLNCDALVTEHSFVLGIRTADCAPVCFSDGIHIGIAHIGWRGLVLGLAEKMLARFDSSRVEVFVGPHLHAFEIKKDFCFEALSQKFGETFFTVEDERILFRFSDALRSCLPLDTVFDTRDTETGKELPSHRRDGTKARFVTVVQCIS